MRIGRFVRSDAPVWSMLCLLRYGSTSVSITLEKLLLKAVISLINTYR